MPIIKERSVVPHTTAQMYQLVNNVEAYAEFLPWCSESRVLSRDEDEVRARLTVSGLGIRKSFTTLNRLQPNKMVEIRLLDGPFKHLEGFWRFDEADEGCYVSLDLDFEMAGGLFDFAFGPLFHQIGQTFVSSFAERADQIYASGGEIEGAL